MNFERVRLSASDGWVLVGDYYPANGSKGVVLMHVLPALKESWRDFALELQRNGISSIALDARGHGESAVPRSFLEFSEADQQKRVLDVQAAEGFLRSRGKTAIFGVGASIGANAVLVYESEWNSLDGIVLLSPGLDYRGLKT
jgi:alpha-beta hydrolase superfamily lysophospholipase